MSTEKEFNFLSSKLYLTEFNVERTQLDQETVLGLIYHTALNHKKFWGKIDTAVYAYALFFSLHERWSIHKFRESDFFNLAEYHNAYWLNVIRSMRRAQHSDDFVQNVISVAMKDFLAIPYRPKYEVLVPYFSAIVGGRSKSSDQEQTLIQALKKEESCCFVPMDEDSKIKIIEDKNSEDAISDLESHLLNLVVPLLFKQVGIRRRTPNENEVINSIKQNSLNISSTVNDKTENNTTSNDTEVLPERTSDIVKSKEDLRSLQNTAWQAEQNQSKSFNLIDILRKYQKVIAILLIVICVGMMYGKGKSQSIPDKKVDERVKELAIQCITLQRKISVLQSMESNKARGQLINLYESEYETGSGLKIRNFVSESKPGSGLKIRNFVSESKPT